MIPLGKHKVLVKICACRTFGAITDSLGHTTPEEPRHIGKRNDLVKIGARFGQVVGSARYAYRFCNLSKPVAHGYMKSALTLT